MPPKQTSSTPQSDRAFELTMATYAFGFLRLMDAGSIVGGWRTPFSSTASNSTVGDEVDAAVQE